MKANFVVTAILALFVSAVAQAQSQPDVHQMKPKLSPEERVAKRIERKTQLAKMTPAERKAFKQTRREQKQARLNAMTPEKRDKVLARRQQHKAMKAGK